MSVKLKDVMDKIKQGMPYLSSLDIEVKKYLPISTKQTIIETLLSDCLIYADNGTIECDYILRDVVLSLVYIFQYTNIEHEESEDEENDGSYINMLDVYDLFQEYGILEAIQNEIPLKERHFISDILDRQIEQRLAFENSIEGIVSKGIDMLVGTVNNNTNPKELQKLIRTLSKEAQKIGINGEGLNKFLGGLVDGNKEEVNTPDVSNVLNTKGKKLVN